VPIAWIEDAWEVKPTFWLPGEGLLEKSRADRVPYDVWANQGYLQTTPGKAIQYEFVAEWLFGFYLAHPRLKIAFDRWNMKHLRPWLIKAGFTEEQVEEVFSEFGQGFQSMSPALRDLESALLTEKVRHGSHPVLTMCAAKASGRIDGAVALAMAFGVAPEVGAEPPAYELLII
jgi:phage terminase large subunit-like protein